MSIEEIIEPTMRPNSPINDISKDEWNYGRSILKGMKIHDVIVHSKKKWIIKDTHTTLEGLLVFMLKYEYNEDDEKVLYKIVALLDNKKDKHYKNRHVFPLCEYINRKPTSIVSKIKTTIDDE